MNRGAARGMRGVAAIAAILLGACASAPVGASPAPSAASSASVSVTDTSIAPGRGTLRQDDIAVLLDLGAVQARLLPLDEGVLRTLAPDSYAALHGIVESRRDAIARAMQLHALHERNVWYATFTGMSPDATYTPGDVTITSAGRPFRPVEIIPLSGGFGSGRVALRQTQGAIYLFDDGLDVSQPLTVEIGAVRSDDWAQSLRRIERERSLINGRR